MFDTLRNHRTKAAAASAGVVAIAALLGASNAAADTKKTTTSDTKKTVTAVKIKSQLPVTVIVTFSGASIGDYQATPGGDAHELAKVDDGTTIRWVAKPKNEADKSQFVQCKGDKKVSGLSDTLTLTDSSCEKAAAAAPKGGSASAPTASSKPAATATWSVTLKGPDKASLDGKPWKVELFDAVACKAAGAFNLAKGEPKTVSVTAREGAGQASKGELGAHLRWRISGVGPGQKAIYFWGDPKPVRNNAQLDITISQEGDQSPTTISGNCDK